MSILEMQNFVYNRVKQVSNAPMSYDNPDDIDFDECKRCGSDEEDKHGCECGAEITEEQCYLYEGYCDDRCVMRYAK